MRTKKKKKIGFTFALLAGFLFICPSDSRALENGLA